MTPQEARLRAERDRLREALARLIQIVDAETIQRDYAFPNARRLEEGANAARAALSEQEGGEPA